MEQTAVEWLVEQLRQLAFDQNHHLGLGDIRLTLGQLDELEEQANAMHKEQIVKAHIEGQPIYSCQSEKAEQYYNETYNK
jgi:hypothetical protein